MSQSKICRAKINQISNYLRVVAISKHRRCQHESNTYQNCIKFRRQLQQAPVVLSYPFASFFPGGGSMKCPHCYAEQSLTVSVDRGTRRKALRASCCDAFVRWCPDPKNLLKLPNLTPDEREFLHRVANLNWFTSRIAANLIQIEEKAKKEVVA